MPPAVAPVILAAMVAAYVAVFATLTWAQQSNFGTFGFDMGIYDQGIWLLSRFEEPFVTVRGLNYFGHHVNLLTLVFVPFYWLGGGPHLLYAAQTVVLALGAVPVWLLARDRLASPWAALVLAGAYLLYPSLQWITWWHFHPEALAVTPLLFAFWLASRRRWGWFAVAVAIAVAAKEDVALAAFVLGLLVAWRERPRAAGEGGSTAGWRMGLATAAATATWWVVCTRVIIPRANGGVGAFYEHLFPGFGDSAPEIAFNLVAHPSRLWDLARAPDAVVYYRKLLFPVALLPLASASLLVAAPQLVVNVISAHRPTHDFRFHYSAVVVAVVFAATVESCARWGRAPSTRRLLVGVVGLAALAANIAWSPSPLGREYETGVWARPQPRHDSVRRALALVPDDAAVTATYYLVPHLTHRRHVYEFPNPFVVANWGVRGENRPDPASVDYLVLDTTVNGDHEPLYRSLVAGPFRVVFERDGIVVASRAEAVTGPAASPEGGASTVP